MYTDNLSEKEGREEENTTVDIYRENKILPVEQNMVSPDLKHSANTKEMKSWNFIIRKGIFIFKKKYHVQNFFM